MARTRSQISVTKAAVVMVAVVVAAAAGFAEAQTPDCASKLAACADYLKSDNPPASCCDPIKEAVATQLECLCNLYTSPDFLPSLGVNVSDALHLSKACGVPVDISKCKKSSAPAPQQGGPPAVPGNDAERLALAGFTSLLLFLASLIFY